MITIADIFVWAKDNIQYLWMIVPLVIVIFFVRSASVR